MPPSWCDCLAGASSHDRNCCCTCQPLSTGSFWPQQQNPSLCTCCHAVRTQARVQLPGQTPACLTCVAKATAAHSKADKLHLSLPQGPDSLLHGGTGHRQAGGAGCRQRAPARQVPQDCLPAGRWQRCSEGRLCGQAGCAAGAALPYCPFVDMQCAACSSSGRLAAAVCEAEGPYLVLAGA